jgi:hypothetical protein
MSWSFPFVLSRASATPDGRDGETANKDGNCGEEAQGSKATEKRAKTADFEGKAARNERKNGLLITEKYIGRLSFVV